MAKAAPQVQKNNKKTSSPAGSPTASAPVSSNSPGASTATAPQTASTPSAPGNQASAQSAPSSQPASHAPQTTGAQPVAGTAKAASTIPVPSATASPHATTAVNATHISNSSASPHATTAASVHPIPELVPPPPTMKPLPAQDNAIVANPKHKSKKFPSIAPTPAAEANATPTASEEAPIRRYTPSGGYYVECFLREVITNIRRNPMMSVASISTVMVLALILGLFTAAVANLDKLAQELANEMQIKVYMADTFPAEEAEAYRQHILKIEHVTDAIFTPKDEAFQRLRERLDSAISLDDLEKNPLPDAFQVPVEDPKYLDQVAHELSQITTVEKVDYGRDAAGKLLALNKVVRLVGLVILLLLFASTVLIVSNTIRLTVFARRKEIDIMQLVGAADWFIRWPFILEGVSQGFVGASLAAIAIDVGYRLVVPHMQRSIAFIPVIAPNDLMPYVCVGLAGIGCLVGAIGSLISVNRYLKA